MFSRSLLNDSFISFGLAEKLDASTLPEDAKYRIYCEDDKGIFIIPRTDADLMPAVSWLLSELAKEGMSSDSGMSISHLNKFGSS